MPKSKVSKPRPLRMSRNMRQYVTLSSAAASCTQWSVKLQDDDETHECGKSVEVELLCFDEGDGKQLRKLAAWLLEAAAWLEAT
jgi:hypothetical protein